MRRLIVTLLGLLCLLKAHAELDLWQTWQMRRETTAVAASAQRLFAVANGSLYSTSLDRPDDVQLYDRASGLGDVDIKQIAWCAEAERLIIYYASGLIDLLSSQGVEHLTALKEATQISQRDLYQIVVRGERAWLSGAFGVIQLDVRRARLEATYMMGQQVYGVAIDPEGELVSIASGQGIKQGRLADNLQDPSSWRDLAKAPSMPWRGLGYHQGQLIGWEATGGLWRFDQEARQIAKLPGVVRLEQSGRELLLYGEQGLWRLGQTLEPLRLGQERAPEHIYGVAGQIEQRTLWLALGQAGVAQLRLEAEHWQWQELPIELESPESNTFFAMRHAHGRLYAVSGGRGANRFSTSGVIQIFDGKRWRTIGAKTVEQQSGVRFADPIDIIPHRDADPDHYYVATWGEGLYEMRGDRLVERFDTHNSALASAVTGTPGYTRVGSLCYDAKGNLWMAQGGGPGAKVAPVVRLSAEGTWLGYDYPEVRETNSFHTHLALPNGTKWLLDNHRSEHGEGVLIYHDRGTDAIGDDASAHYASLMEASGRSINFSKLTAMALDRRGTLWLGSNIGYFSVANPQQPPTNASRPPIVSRPIGGVAPNLYYILDNVPISAIAVDPMNRKWMGTDGDGLYLISADGLQVLRHYRSDNSPLLDNHILSLAIDEQSGRLYVGTSYGLNSLETGTSLGEQSQTPQAIAYPNPLRPEHIDGITLEGVPAGASIQVTDASGRLVHRGQSVDQIYRWDTYTTDGMRLPSGVYTIRIYAPTAGRPQLLRVSIIRATH